MCLNHNWLIAGHYFVVIESIVNILLSGKDALIEDNVKTYMGLESLGHLCCY